SVIRDVLVRVDPAALDRALQQWNAAFGQKDQSLAIDGKTMCKCDVNEGLKDRFFGATEGDEGRPLDVGRQRQASNQAVRLGFKRSRS
ncbi:MAG: hypothetical protein ACYDHM_13960, partial [Acidiferrobacterales bacterium]